MLRELGKWLKIYVSKKYTYVLLLCFGRLRHRNIYKCWLLQWPRYKLWINAKFLGYWLSLKIERMGAKLEIGRYRLLENYESRKEDKGINTNSIKITQKEHNKIKYFSIFLFFLFFFDINFFPHLNIFIFFNLLDILILLECAFMFENFNLTF